MLNGMDSSSIVAVFLTHCRDCLDIIIVYVVYE